MTDTTVVTIVAYELKGEDYTAELVAKQGLFWLVRDPVTGVEKKIPAKAVTETWEETAETAADQYPDPSDIQQQAYEDAQAAADAVADTEPPAIDDEAYSEADNPTTNGFLPAPPPSLADQAAAGPVIADPGDTITLKDLCEDQGVEPRIARRQLRAAAAKGSPELTASLATDTHEAGGSWVFKRSAIEAVMLIITARQRG